MIRCCCCRTAPATRLLAGWDRRPRVDLLCADCFAADAVLELVGGDCAAANDVLAVATGVGTVPGW